MNKYNLDSYVEKDFIKVTEDPPTYVSINKLSTLGVLKGSNPPPNGIDLNNRDLCKFIEDSHVLLNLCITSENYSAPLALAPCISLEIIGALVPWKWSIYTEGLTSYRYGVISLYLKTCLKRMDCSLNYNIVSGGVGRVTLYKILQYLINLLDPNLSLDYWGYKLYQSVKNSYVELANSSDPSISRPLNIVSLDNTLSWLIYMSAFDVPIEYLLLFSPEIQSTYGSSKDMEDTIKSCDIVQYVAYSLGNKKVDRCEKEVEVSIFKDKYLREVYLEICKIPNKDRPDSIDILAMYNYKIYDEEEPPF